METIRHKAAAVRRKKDFILAQTLLLLAALTVAIVDSEGQPFGPIIVFGLVAAALTAYTQTVDAFLFYEQTTQSLFVVVDTVLVFGILLAAGVGKSVTIPFFSTVIAVAVLKNGLFLGPAAALIAVLSVLSANDPIFDPASAVARPVLIMAAAVFYWHVVSSEPEEQRERSIEISD